MAEGQAQSGELPSIQHEPTPLRASALSGIVALLALCCVAPLLAWVFGFGSFASWFRYLSVPSVAAVAAIGIWITRSATYPRLRTGMILGAAGGFFGTILYDLARVPFVALGMRLFAPIDSYGVLLTDARASSGLTDFAGWGFHFTNGICFGVAYGAVMLGRSRWWAVAWAMVLESAAVLTPFADVYGLRANPTAVVIAYGAHVPYGLAIGYFVSEGEPMVLRLREITARPVSAALVVLVVALALWLRPLPPYPSGAATEVQRGRFTNVFLRVAPDGCAAIANRDDSAYTIANAAGSPELPPRATTSVCFSGAGVARVKTSDEPYSGGFVIVDPALAP